MSYSNDITDLVNKIERRLGMLALTPHLPKELGKDAWANVIKTDTLKTFSRYFPRKILFVINSQTCNKITENKRTWYVIKDEYLGGQKLLGAYDLSWDDLSSNNISLGQTAGYGYYIPNYGGVDSTYEAFIAQQLSADVASMYNNQMYVDFQYPNRVRIVRAGGVDVNLNEYAIYLLVEHSDLSTISPTKMEIFEQLAQADIANFLYMNLRYVDNLETIYINIDLKLNELNQQGDRRQEILDKIEQSYVSAANDNIPYIMTTNA